MSVHNFDSFAEEGKTDDAGCNSDGPKVAQSLDR